MYELIAIGLMIFALFLIMIPSVPVTVLEWAIAIIYAALTGFERLGLVGAGLVTLLMIAGITSSLWMPFLGLQGRKISCLTMVAFFVGMFLGAAIPIPIFGSFLGGAIAVFIVEYLNTGDHDHALESSEATFMVIVMSMLVEFLMAAAIIVITVISILLTIPSPQ